MRVKNWFGFLLVGALALSARAESIQTLDLKPFVGRSPLEKIGAAWLLPHGQQVIDGIPFQIDGAVMLRDARGSGPKGKSKYTIVISNRFECLHLLATAPSRSDDGTVLGRFELQYDDGTSSTLKVVNGVQVRHWFGPWHKADEPLGDPNAREAWRAFCAEAAGGDAYLRFFHVVLTNPSPEKVVRTLAMDPKRNQAALMVVAMSIGPRVVAEGQPDTVIPPKSPLPDLRPRSGELVPGEGVIKTEGGEAIAGARVRITGVQKFADDRVKSPVDDSAVNKEAVTGADGRFAFEPLPDNQLYKLMVFAESYETARYGGLDPKSDPIEVRLKPAGAAGKFAVRGRVVGPEGKPVAGARVEPEGVSTGTGTRWGGRQDFPEQVLTGLNGEFVMGRNKTFTRVQLNFIAPGLARLNLWLAPTNGQQTIEMGVGAVLQGRVTKDGKPLADVRVGVSGADRSAEVFAGHFETKTDQDGRFTFQHLPPDTTWNFYGIISSLKAQGALASRPVRTSTHGETNNLGELEVKPGLLLAGRIKTAHGEAMPGGLKVRVGNDAAWDSQTAAVNKSGEFEFEGLYPGQWNVSIDERNWHLSAVNRSLDMWSGQTLTGLLEQDKDDLLLMIENGKYEYSSSPGGNGQLPQQDWPQNRPLAGAEPGGAPLIVLAGQVLDDKTGEPLKAYKVIPGYQPPVTAPPPAARPVLKRLLEPFARKAVPWNERPFWKFARASWYTNTNFAVGFVPLSSTPMLRIEAPDYLPFETTPTNVTTSNLVIRLERGAGPNGVVLQPDGKPAAGATVLFGSSQEQFGLSGKELSEYGHREAKRVTGPDGKFSFPARSNGQMLFVAHKSGWVEEPVASGGENLKLRLQPWAVLVGTLVDTTGAPMPGVELTYTFPSDWQRGDPHINVNSRMTTDAKGQFQFAAVPPRRVEVARVVPFGPAPYSGWSYKPQTWLVAEPGTNDLGKVTYDQPPPPPMLEQIKRRLGL